MATVKTFLKWTFRFVLLFILFIVCFVIGSMAVAGKGQCVAGVTGQQRGGVATKSDVDAVRAG